MSHTNGNGSLSMSAFLAGAFIGAGVALLFAPQTGTQLRSTLRRYAGKAQEQISDVMEQGKEYVERGQEYIEEGQDALAAAGKMVDKAFTQGKKYIKSSL